jgi:hypothetical protein
MFFVRRSTVNTESLRRNLQLVVLLSAVNTFATLAMAGHAYQGKDVQAFASAPEAFSLNADPSFISAEGVVLDR